MHILQLARRAPLLALLLTVFSAQAGPTGLLNDTGQTQCDNGSNVLEACSNANTGDASAMPRQDGRFGRDAKATAGTLTKIGGGAAGFDYSKIANDGSDLGAGVGLALGTNPTDWACTRDNITGLIWEVKTATSTDLRYSSHTYLWYSTDGSTNGGNAGSTGSDTCNGTLAPSNLCNTEAYVTAVNTPPGLCGHTDWRMPTHRELFTLVHVGTQNPSIDTTYFPNTQALNFWSGSSSVRFPSTAWAVYFFHGSIEFWLKSSTQKGVRLVRDVPF